MELSRAELIKLKNHKMYPDIFIKKEEIKDSYLRGIKDLKVELSVEEDLNESLSLNLKLKGYMICPCAITLEDVLVPFDLDEKVNIDQNGEDAYEFGDMLNLNELIYDLIAKEIPLKVVKKGKIDYPIGDGWKVMSEAEYANEHKNQQDPRWAKLKEYQSDEEE